ncbi:unnamed protein product [Fraxinus pennsylvanica]|uniref:Uncharacterized protein n=1 Tax=Fraxinus pennsylvanica TaxID=56036 RepID=A0AAD1ZPG4_9LAMI|nr:unnamed protein product [Fraxinus pennsylvanica]
MGKTPCCDKTKLKKGLWSAEEDATLRNYIKKYGTGGNWTTFPHKAGLNRCGKSCRLRWSVISSHLPGRTDNDVKNHWNSKLKKKPMAAAYGYHPAKNIDATTAVANATTTTMTTITDLLTSTTNTLVPTFSAQETSPIMPCLTDSRRYPSFSSSSRQDSAISGTFARLGENFMFGNGSFSKGIPMDDIGNGYSYEILSEIWSQEATIEGVPNLN